MTRNNLLLFCAVLLTALLVRVVVFYQNQPNIPVGQEIELSGKIISEPTFKNNFQNLQVKTDLGIKIYVIALQEEEYVNGEGVRIVGALEKRLLSSGSHEIYTIFLPQITRVKSQLSPILALASIVRQKITSFYNRNLPPDSAALLLGIVFGVKANLSKDFMQHLQTAGVMHIIAASGMNVTLIGGFLSSFLVLFLRRQWAIAITILGLIFYATLAGLGASIIRATIMGALVFTSQILGRQYLASYGLFLAGFIMLFIAPDLIFDIGFQLSFMATAGLLWIRPIIDMLFSRGFIKKIPVIEDLTTTIAAQIATLPILFVNFGNYSLWSIVANALVLWTIPPLMILGGIGAVLSFILEPVARLLVYLCLPLFWYFEGIIKLFPVSEGKSQLSIPWQLVIGYYLIVISFVWWSKLRKHEEKNN